VWQERKSSRSLISTTPCDRSLIGNYCIFATMIIGTMMGIFLWQLHCPNSFRSGPPSALRGGDASATLRNSGPTSYPEARLAFRNNLRRRRGFALAVVTVILRTASDAKTMPLPTVDNSIKADWVKQTNVPVVGPNFQQKQKNSKHAAHTLCALT